MRISGFTCASRFAAASTFGVADVGHREQQLALQVGEVDRVRIHERDRAHAGRGEELRDRVAEPARADDERVRRGEALLRVGTELVEQEVAAVAEELLVVHGGSVPRGSRGPMLREAPR